MKASELARKLLETPDCDVVIRRFEYDNNGDVTRRITSDVEGVWMFSIADKWLELSTKERKAE